MADDALFNCTCCNTSRTAAQFKTKSNGARAKTCIPCGQSRKATRTKKASNEKENSMSAAAGGADDEEGHGEGLGVLPLTDFLDVLMQQDDNLELEARVDISSFSGDRQTKADQLKKSIWSRMKYRFVYNSKYEHRRTPSTRFVYHCAQNADRQNAPKKSERDGAKHRDKLSMDTFKCRGWLHITINDWDETAFVKIAHEDDHIPYWSIDVPDDVVEYVHQNPKLTPGQLWSEILKTHPKPPFTRRAIYTMWAEANAMEWKRDPDELKSANILLEEFTSPQPQTGKDESMTPMLL
ncbi:hypothetical protein C8J57DRAFT_1239257 [Mycena rebaudengoi]|nr:hypothetical protein C8J57DRAFT_1239257 [Mycena rebaudengoi]